MNNFNTPIIELINISKKLNRSNIYLKLESTNPISHTFKDRGALGVIEQMKKENKSLVLAGTCSNMGVAISGMASKYAMDSVVVISSSAPIGMINMMKTFSTKSIVIEGGFDEVDKFIGKLSEEFPHITCVNTNFNQYFFKGYYSIIDELHLQLDKNKTYHIIVPTADGTLISSLYKRYKEISQNITMARLIFHIAQPSGCAPIVDAINKNTKIEPLENSLTKVIPLSVKKPLVYGKSAINSVVETGGSGIKVDENDINDFTNTLTKQEGIYSDNVGGVLLGAIYQLSKKIKKDENILGIYTGNGLVYACENSEKTILSQQVAKEQIYKILEEK